MMMGIMRLLIRWADRLNEMKLYRIKFMTIWWTLVEWWKKRGVYGSNQLQWSNQNSFRNACCYFSWSFGQLPWSLWRVACLELPEAWTKKCLSGAGGGSCSIRYVYAPHYVAIWLGQISARPRCVFHFSSRAAWQSVCLTARLPACRVLTQLALRGPKQQLKTIANAETIAALDGLFCRTTSCYLVLNKLLQVIWLVSK